MRKKGKSWNSPSLIKAIVNANEEGILNSKLAVNKELVGEDIGLNQAGNVGGENQGNSINVNKQGVNIDTLQKIWMSQLLGVMEWQAYYF